MISRHTRPPRLGFGTWALGGEGTLGGKELGWGPTDAAEAEATVREAAERGIDLFDTADVYGNGLAERRLGEWLPAWARVCTKFGNREDAAGRGQQDFGASWLAASVEGSLRRLRRERLDVLLLHSPPDDFDWATYDPGPFERLQRGGIIGRFGVSCRSVKGAARVVASGFGSVLEVIYNAVDRRAERSLLTDARAAHYEVLARVPLASGFLADAFVASPAPSFLPTDFRSGLAAADVAWRCGAASKLAFLRELPGGLAVSAIRFALSREEISAVVPGMRTRAQLQQALRAHELGPLDRDTLRAIAAAVPSVYPGWES